MRCTRPSHLPLAEAAVRHVRSLTAGGLLLILAACGPERAVEPAIPAGATEPDLRAQAFKLTIDTRSGRIDVAPPARGSANVEGLSLSLLGGDAIELDLHTGYCEFSPIPDRSKKRCTMDIQIRNRLAATDLVTPTTLPRPPQGTSGILVFPFTATTPAGEEVAPNADWDLGPANFFNDNTCSGSGKTDCFRYELFPSPLYAGASTPIRQVGFDIPASAGSVTVYVIVAADVRDNPVQTRTLSAVPQLCGYIDYYEVPPSVALTRSFLFVGSTTVSFCSFPNSLPAGARVQRASLRLFAYRVAWTTVQRVNWGTTLEPSDLLLPTLNSVGGLQQEDPAYASFEARWYAANAWEAVQAGVNEGQTYIQFRIIRDPDATEGQAAFAGTGDVSNRHPQLVVQYTLR